MSQVADVLVKGLGGALEQTKPPRRSMNIAVCAIEGRRRKRHTPEVPCTTPMSKRQAVEHGLRVRRVHVVANAPVEVWLKAEA